MRELFDLFAAQVIGVQVEMMLRSTIRTEVNRIAMPHGKRVGPVRVRHVFAGVVLEIVNGDGLCQSSRVALPGAEIAKDLVVSDLRSIGRVRSQAAFLDWKRFGKTPFYTHAEWPLDPSIGRIAAREKYNPLAVGCPRNDFIMDSHAVAERMRATLEKSQLLRLAAFHRHDIDVEIAVVLTGERYPSAVGRKLREQFASGMRGDAPRYAA